MDDAARGSGLSLKAYCVRRLSTVDLGIAGDEDVASLFARAKEVVGDALSAIVLPGSWMRGETAASSDVDVLVVDAHAAVGRALYSAWDAGPTVTWRGRRLDPHFVHLVEDGEFTGLWAEIALDGIVLLDRDWNLSVHLSRVRHDIAVGRLVRRSGHGHLYWK